jgi:hypothetical protein
VGEQDQAHRDRDRVQEAEGERRGDQRDRVGDRAQGPEAPRADEAAVGDERPPVDGRELRERLTYRQRGVGRPGPERGVR